MCLGSQKQTFPDFLYIIRHIIPKFRYKLPMKLYLVRHGETEANTQGIIQGQSDTRLTPRGVRQAQELGKRLNNEAIDAIFSSDLGRARETSAEINHYLDLPIRFLPELRERHFGEFQGTSFPGFKTMLSEQGLDFYHYRPPGGESLSDLEARVRSCLMTLVATHHGKSIVVSCHGGTNSMFIKVLLNLPREDWHSIVQSNACVNIFDIDPSGNGNSVLINCIRHLNDVENVLIDGDQGMPG